MQADEQGFAKSNIALILGSLLILLPSIDTANKYFGIRGIAVFLCIGLVGLFISVRYILPILRDKISENVFLYLSAAMFIGLAVASAIGYQLATSRRFGAGSDADDALIIAAQELFSGNYPYYKETYLKNGISPMPGSVLISAPFTLSGTIYLLNVFWLGVLFLIIRRISGNAVAFFGIALMLAFSPTSLQNLATGSDYIANTAYILFGIWALLTTAAYPSSPNWQAYAAAVFFGLTLSSRSNFLVLLPLIFSALYQIGGFWQSMKYLTVAGIACLAVTLPFYIWDPAGFTPLIVQANKVTSIETVLPHAGKLIPLSGFLAAGIFALRQYKANDPMFWWYCAIVQFIILVFTTVVHSIKLGEPDIFVGQSGYGMFTLVFAGVAFALTFLPRSSLSETAEPEIAS